MRDKVVIAGGIHYREAAVLRKWLEEPGRRGIEIIADIRDPPKEVLDQMGVLICFFDAHGAMNFCIDHRIPVIVVGSFDPANRVLTAFVISFCKAIPAALETVIATFTMSR